MEERAKPIKLSELGVEVVDVTISTSYGRSVMLPIKLLTWHEWSEIGSAVRNPATPKPRLGESTPNFYDQQYQHEMAEANEERAYRRLAAALVGGGNDIPGETLEEQAQNVREVIEIGIANALLSLLEEMAAKGKARILTRAETFRDGRLGAAGDAGARAVASDEGAVGGAG